jgi:hypothetical protein
MIHTKTKLPQGDIANGRAEGGDIVIYLSKKGAVYFCKVKNYNTAPEVEKTQVLAYCDEICPIPGGGHIERRGNILKIRN